MFRLGLFFIKLLKLLLKLKILLKNLCDLLFKNNLKKCIKSRKFKNLRPLFNKKNYMLINIIMKKKKFKISPDKILKKYILIKVKI